MLESEGFVIMAALEAARPQAKIRDETRALYVQFLGPYPTDLVERAVRNLIRSEEGWDFPTIAKVIRYVEAERNRQPAFRELTDAEEILIPPPPEAIRAMRELTEAQESRSNAFEDDDG